MGKMEQIDNSKDELYIAALIKHNWNPTKAYLEVYPGTSSESARRAASLLMKKIVIRQRISALLKSQVRGICKFNDKFRQLVSLGNTQSSLNMDLAKALVSTIYRRCREIINLLSPMDVEGVGYVRVGGDNDGGYVMLDDFKRKIEAAYSFGIGSDVSWDEAMACRGIDVFMYDHTIEELP